MPLELAPLQVLAWLATYLVHSTLLLALAWLVTRHSSALSLASRERLWKLAVAGGLLTATLQVGLGLEPPLGRFALHNEPPALVAAAPEPGAPQDEAPQDVERLVAWLSAHDQARAQAPRALGATPASSDGIPVLPAGRARQARARSATRFPPLATQLDGERQPTGLPAAVVWPLQAGVSVVARSLPTAPAPAASNAARTEPALEVSARRASGETARELGAVVPENWSRGALAGWSLAGLACMLLFALGLRRLRRDLGGRVELVEGALVAQVERLRLRAGVPCRVRVFVAPRLAAPLSMGWIHPAICLPPRALEELEPAERSAMLAHEVAHLARRDPPWLFALWLVETVFFFQPLNRLARRELAAGFELAADTWAARATGERLALASCLARIAGWIVGSAPPGAQRAFTAAMADALDARRPRSRLGERIERLLDPDALVEPRAPRRLETSLGLSLLAGLALLAPGAVAAVEQNESSSREAPPAAAPAPAPVSDATASPFSSLDAELERLEVELAALRAELLAAGLEARYGSMLDELARRVERLGTRRARIEALLERARALETAGLTVPTPWQDEPLPSAKD